MPVTVIALMEGGNVVTQARFLASILFAGVGASMCMSPQPELQRKQQGLHDESWSRMELD